MYKAEINVTLKKSVLDPQGQTVLHALSSLGYQDAKDLRIGKYFQLIVDEKDRAKAESRIREMCDKVLINPVIEEYNLKISEHDGRRS